MPIFLGTILIVVLFIMPLLLTVANFIFLFRKVKSSRVYPFELKIEQATLFFGTVLSLLYITFSEIVNMDWQEVLINNQRHIPVAGAHQPTIAVLLGVGWIGYFLLRYLKLPPLLTVLSISAIYIGIILALTWMIQVFRIDSLDFFLLLLPFNCILIGLKAIKEKVSDWQLTHRSNSIPQEAQLKNALLTKLANLLNQSHYWTRIAFVLLFPLLGIILCVLLVFGQQPDSFIQAWTQTSQWNLSQQVSPPNIQMDEHYLCTVAASGHRKLVKPQRMGIRHGHSVVVNRQLCIANAFEQILEEKVPSIHRPIRKFYDTYGFPIANMIHSTYAADLIYLLMKPAEYFFLLVLYLTDSHPENRIALQYITKPNVTSSEETI